MMKRALVYAFMVGKGLGWIFLAAAIFTQTLWVFVSHTDAIICS